MSLWHPATPYTWPKKNPEPDAPEIPGVFIDMDLCTRVLEQGRKWIDGSPVWSQRRIAEELGFGTSWDFRVMYTPRTPGDLTRMAVRDMWIADFGFAIPSLELMNVLAGHGRIIEVGAGSGYMTRMMRNHGVDVIGSDARIESYAFEPGIHDPEQVIGQAKTMVRRHRDRTVFCSWPSLRHTWFRQMLRAMRIGQKLIVIRESACADDDAWDYLDACFILDREVDIPRFDYIRDYCEVWTKKWQRPT